MAMHRKNLQQTYEDNESDDNEDQRTLFCGNVDEKVTEDLLYEVFLQAGPIESARIPKDHSGRQRTFGFVTYVHKATLPYALQLYQGLTLFRKTLTIKYQGNTQPSPMRSYPSPGCSNTRSDNNSSFKSDTYSSPSPLKNPFRNSFSPDYISNSGKNIENILKHPSSQRKSHSEASPYQRKSGYEDRNRDRDRNKDQNKRRQFNNGTNRHSDQRFSGNNRR